MKRYIIIIIVAYISVLVCSCTGEQKSDDSDRRQSDTTNQVLLPIGNPFYEDYCISDSIIGEECEDALAFLKGNDWELVSSKNYDGCVFSYKFKKNSLCDIEMEIRPGETGKVYGVFVIYENWGDNPDFEQQDIYLDFIKFLNSSCNYRECQMVYGTQDEFDYFKEEYIRKYDIMIEDFSDVFRHIAWDIHWSNDGKGIAFGRFNGGDGFGHPELEGKYASLSITNREYR